MGLMRKLHDAVSSFAEIPTVAMASSMKRNPIDKSVEGLLTNPQYDKVDGLRYVKFGTRNDMPDVIQILKSKSSTHSGIMNRKAKMVAGDELTATGTIGKKKTAWEVFFKQAGGVYGKDLEQVWKDAVNIYEVYGSVAFIRIVDGNEIVTVKALSPMKFRVGELNSDNQIDHLVVRATFARNAGAMYKGTARKVPLFDPEKNDKESAIYVMNPASENDFYGIPNYIGAYNFIEADYDFGVTIHNSAENGFQPKVMATFVGRNMSEAQKETHANKWKSNFHGADGEIAIVNYVRREEEMPKVDKLDIQNLDKTISTMATLNDSKILTAHSVTNPTLFGITVAGKLGNSGTELESSYNIFRAAETIPNRNLLINAMTLLFTNTQFDGVTFKVKDINISPQENRGGDTTSGKDNTNPSDETKDTAKNDTKTQK